MTSDFHPPGSEVDTYAGESEYPVPQELPVPIAWTFVGPVVGYDSVRLSDGTDSESEGDVMYGLVAGVDVNVGGAFVGVEGEWSDSEVGATVEDVITLGDEAGVEVGRTLYVGGRLGTNLGAAKIYAKGGYINTKVEGFYDDGVDIYSADTELDGWVLGAGVQTRISPVVLRLEYRYANYGEVEVLGVGTDIDASRHQVVLGALFAF
ncbi:MAG: porin family protein [Oxalobacteraceae bacterium]|nr:MAG: porin family protein [Oxalobacteraceae bacterium]